jgi:DNA polymerase (family 10)
MELEGGDAYRARAYGSLPPPGRSTDRRRPRERIPGIGDALESVITRLHETGEHAGLNAMREKVPLRIPGLKPDRIRKLRTDLCISSVAALEAAARSDKLKAPKG